MLYYIKKKKSETTSLSNDLIRFCSGTPKLELNVNFDLFFGSIFNESIQTDSVRSFGFWINHNTPSLRTFKANICLEQFLDNFLFCSYS